MSLTDIFIKKPVLASVVSILIFVLGLKSFFGLELRQYPKVDNTTITITTAYIGASANVVQGFVTTPLQTAISSADGIDTLSSTSTQGLSTIKAKLRLNFDAPTAFADILAKVNSVKQILPREATDPVITKSTGSTIALMYLSYASDKLKFPQIYDFLARVVQPKLQSVPGISSADILGGNPFAMRIWLNPKKMASLGITIDDVNQALQNNNFISAAGQLKGVYTLTTLNARTDLRDAEEFEELVVRENKGRLIRMREIATVELGSESYSSSVTFNGKKGVFIGVNALPSANPLTVIQDVRAVLPSLERALPPSMSQQVVYDSTKFISASIRDVIKTLLEAAVIVIVVIFLFLGSLRSVFIPIVTIPLSLIGVGFVMLALGYSINLLTLLAMVLAIGLVVDDAIVVLENIYRHIEEGVPPVEAAIKGAREILMPVVSMTITLAAVYAPIGFMGGLTGALFKEFAITLAASVFVSGIIALTLSPMMCSKILIHDTNPESFSHKVDRVFTKLQNWYERTLHRILDVRSAIIFFGTVVLFSVYFLYSFAPKELAPQEDQGFLAVFSGGPSYSNINYTETYSKEVDKIFKKVPELAASFQVSGMGAENSGFNGLVLKPWSERSRTPKQIQPTLQQELNQVSGIRAFAFMMPDLPTGSDGMPVQFVIRSFENYKNLYNIAEQFVSRAKKSGQFIVVQSDLSYDKPQLDVTIDRDKAGEMNISMATIGRTLGGLLGGNYTNLFSMEGRSYKIIPQLPDVFRHNPDDLQKVFVRSNKGSLVPLSNIVSFKMSTVPDSLKQFGQLNSATISGVPMVGQTMADSLAFLKKTADEILPKSMSYDYSGESRALMSEGNALLYTFVFALVIIFLVLAAQFESFTDPLIILVSVPMAICGALIPLALGITSMNIYSQIGLVTLIGLITKHGILMVEFANKLKEEENLTVRAAIEKSASIRLRPILMTTAAMVLGTFPLVIATGAGAASRFSIGLVIVTGLTIGTIFTLFVVPTVYTLISKEKKH